MPTMTHHQMALLLIDRYNESVESAAEAVWDMEDKNRVDVVLRNLYMISTDAERMTVDESVDVSARTSVSPLALSAYDALLVSATRSGDFASIESNAADAVLHGGEHAVAFLVAFLRLAANSAS